MTTLQTLIETNWLTKCDEIDKRYSEIAQERVKGLREIIVLELSLVESARGIFSEPHLDLLRQIFVDVRFSNNLLTGNRLYKRLGADIHKRHVVKLLFALYKYNRYIITSGENSEKVYLSSLQSRVRYATICPHCGDEAAGVLRKLRGEGRISIPNL